jgi:hypothetical protein
MEKNTERFAENAGSSEFLIHVDSLRYNHLYSYHHSMKVTP